MPTLLLEIGCEELPAWACYEAEEQLPALCEEHLLRKPAQVFVGPRRLAVLVEDLPEKTPDEWMKGPPEAMRERAAAGFAKRHGVDPDALTVRDGFLGVEVPGRLLREVLPERIDAVVRGLRFSRSMRWDESGLRFPRPVRWICAKLDTATIQGGTTHGHRFTHGEIMIPSADTYLETLRAAGVEPDGAARRRAIEAALPEGWSDPLGVLDEVVQLVESPRVQEGSFDERYLQLPERVIVTAMQSHQRYFPLGGNRFAFVANGGDPELVRRGNENVLENRLADATFTFDRDLAVGIDGLAEKLGAITFLAGAGSFADKTERVVALVRELGGGEATLEAARLAKADQAAELVAEFPVLQGHIGAEYARVAGYPEAVSTAIDEQYLPDSAGGQLPRTEAGKVLAAADKIDTLVTAFALGHRPTGSRDPYGLRRAAIGLVRLALEGGLRIEPPEEIADFVEERLESLLDVPVEFVRAARASSVADVGGIARLARELGLLDEGRLARLHTAYTRSHRLAGKSDAEAAATLDPGLLEEVAEREVAETLAQVDQRVAAALAEGDVEAAIDAAIELDPPLHRFFDEVLVMADDRAVRANRLRLLLDVRDTVGMLGDFSQLPL